MTGNETIIKRPRGRPRKPAGTARNRYIGVCVSEEEYLRIWTACEKMSVSEWIRAVLLRELVDQDRTAPIE